MNNQKHVIALIKQVSGQANVLTIPRLFITLCSGSHHAALFLSQCVYWSDKNNRDGGWFWKTYAEWEEEIGLKAHAIIHAQELTSSWVNKRVERHGGTNKTFYQTDMDALILSVMELLGTEQEEGEPEVGRLSERESRVSEREGRLSLLEESSIAKTTSKTTKRGAAQKPRPPNPLFDAVTKVCGIDPSINGNGSSIGKVCSALASASPPYTPSEVEAWGALQTWRATPPTIWQLQQGVGAVRAKGNGQQQLTLAEAEEMNRKLNARRAR